MLLFSSKIRKDCFPSFELPFSDVKILPNKAQYVCTRFLAHCPNYTQLRLHAQGKASCLIQFCKFSADWVWVGV